MHDLEHVSSQNNLVVAKAANNRTKGFSQGYGSDKGFPLCEIFRAEFGKVKDDVVLNHVEGIVLKAKHVALLNQFQRFQRTDVVHPTLSGKEVLNDSNRLDILIGLEIGTHQSIDNLQLCLAVFNLIKQQKVLVVVYKLLVICLHHQIQNLRQIAAPQSGLDKLHIGTPHIFMGTRQTLLLLGY